ncbi:MAG: hypothetical protein AAFX87_21405 [Bacteroidota bacterium]
MAFNGTEGKPIDLRKAKRWTKRYREQCRENGEKNPIKAHFFGCDIINDILAEEGCKGIRIYYGLNDDGEKQLLLVGAKADHNNILPSEVGGKDGASGIIADDSATCPTVCPEGDDPLGDG